jgi:hypothetical protein
MMFFLFCGHYIIAELYLTLAKNAGTFFDADSYQDGFVNFAL